MFHRISFLLLLTGLSITTIANAADTPIASQIQQLQNKYTSMRKASENQYNQNVQQAAQTATQSVENAKAPPTTPDQTNTIQPPKQTQASSNQTAECLCKPTSVKDSNYIFSRKGKPLYQLTPYCQCSPKSKIVPKTANGTNNSIADLNSQNTSSNNNSFSIQY